MTSAKLNPPELQVATPAWAVPWYGVCQASGWGLVALVNVSFALSGDANLRLGFIALSLWGGALGLLLSHQWRRALKRRAVFDEGRPLPLPFLVGGVVALALVQVSLVAMGFYIWRQSSVQNGWGWLPPALAFWLFMYAAWTVFYGAVMAARRAKRFEIETLQLQLQVKDAELRALQAQINPHFFFNALNTLYGTIARENGKARRLVLRLSDLFRYSFAPDRGFIALEEEMRIVRAYLEIEELRLGPRLSVEIDVEEGALGVRVPVLSIQPLVENAVKHGVAARSGPGFVRLRAVRREGRLEVEIANSGEFGAAGEAGHGTGVGLGNVKRRLALCYGERGELKISGDRETTSVRFSVPVEDKEAAEIASSH